MPVEGEHLFDLFCIESGRVRVAFDTLEGRQRSVIAFEAGGIFNLACAMAQKKLPGSICACGTAWSGVCPGGFCAMPEA